MPGPEAKPQPPKQRNSPEAAAVSKLGVYKTEIEHVYEPAVSSFEDEQTER